MAIHVSMYSNHILTKVDHTIQHGYDPCTMTTPKPGDFSFLTNVSDRIAYDELYRAVTKADAWSWLKEDPGSGGFMFNTSNNMERIYKNMDDNHCHSGSSLAICLRQMQFIARNGWEAWVAGVTAAITP